MAASFAFIMDTISVLYSKIHNNYRRLGVSLNILAICISRLESTMGVQAPIANSYCISVSVWIQLGL